jgi:hypothetical protein
VDKEGKGTVVKFCFGRARTHGTYAPPLLCGTLSNHVEYFFNLIHLDVSHNRLEGAIPTRLGALRKLKYVALNHNGFIGIPRESTVTYAIF